MLPHVCHTGNIWRQPLLQYTNYVLGRECFVLGISQLLPAIERAFEWLLVCCFLPAIQTTCVKAAARIDRQFILHIENVLARKADQGLIYLFVFWGSLRYIWWCMICKRITLMLSYGLPCISKKI
ncbi:hypothetical protein FGO68_gene7563 [Halteria grandinella]|uniref:Uncharacterized protein n=1 Tax=Halteria grandinella TaxID=5974 RepID=A0A8J8NLA3_HALGN|nr:hypothetical protein FGO68_gene7563 [Halteria grandinella]